MDYDNIQYTESDVIKFEVGILGFQDKQKYVFIPSGDDEFQFHWLQSIEEEELTFIVTNPFLFVENYDFDIPDDIVEKLEVEKIEDVVILSIVNVNEELTETTINLKAPLIINKTKNLAAQVVLDEAYPYKYFIFNKELNDEV